MFQFQELFSRDFNIQFTGIEDKRSHDLIGVNTSGLTGASITGSVTKLLLVAQ